MSAVSVDRLRPGDHACLTFSDPDERLDLLAGFIGAGLARGERVVCYSEAIGARDLRRHGLDGAEAVVHRERLWDPQAGPDAKAMVAGLADELGRAGDAGLRITADMCWAMRPRAGAEQLLAFENEVGVLFATGRLTAICEYDRESFDPVTLGYAARVHPRTVAATVYHEDARLRICRQHVPPGVRVSGELDAAAGAEALADALAEAVRLDPDVHVNLNRVTDLAPGAAACLIQVANALPLGRHMVVTCPAPIGRLLAGVPSLKVLSREL
ncbi:MEDS domain-containing protein [Actinoplanes aureus]|uniref:MEDS domain-containing protein n=1 Tax=Actinoplanes aureus TaxID=2792083 RepID=A0A931FUN1_9ACTN|nr:MEDS domain-containing protein [Actinoplanes aureus]MBG0560413.1 MEDS domain-containing protein [Actinoplanes aureus]